ncbi:hypothetical protein ACS0TY_035178 [Phlomoides rotata]
MENPIHDTESDQQLGEDEEELFIGFENLDVSPGDNQICLVGRFILEQPTNFNLLKSRIVGVWRPQMGVNIINIGDGRLLFQFYHPSDLQRVLDGSPWSFGSHPMILRQLQFGEIPLQVSLNKLCYWVHVHDLPVGAFSEGVGRVLGNYIGRFITYDETNRGAVWRDFMQIRVEIDVGEPLKIGKKIRIGCRDATWVKFKYEGYIYFALFVAGWDTPRLTVTLKSLLIGGDGAVPAASPVAGRSVSSGGVGPEAAIIVNDPKGKSVVTDGGTSNSLNDLQSVWRVTGFYGFPDRAHRRESWNLLKLLSQQNDLPWLCVGDFKDLLFQSDKRGRVPHPNWLFTSFRDIVNVSGLYDLPLSGYGYTSSRGRGTPNFVEERLDRAMRNAAWHGFFPNAKLLNLVAAVSDHNPIVVDTIPIAVTTPRNRSFRFENSWMLEDGFANVVNRSWFGLWDLEVLPHLVTISGVLNDWGTYCTKMWRADKKRLE